MSKLAGNRSRSLRCAVSACALTCLLALFWGCGSPGGAQGSHGHGHGGDEGEGHGHGHDDHGHDEHGHGEHADEVTLTPDAINRYRVVSAPAERLVLSTALAAAGRVDFNRTAMAVVGAPLTGRVAEIVARPGDIVAKGAPLLILESTELAEAESTYRSKRAEADAARSAYERGKTLREKAQAIALGELQKREAEFKAADAAANAAESTLRLFGYDDAALRELAASGKQRRRFPVVSPIAGSVVEQSVAIGELVSPERQSLLVVAELSTLWVIADIPEARLREIRGGERARVVIPALGTEAIEGKVTFIAPVLEEATRTAEVRIEVENTHRRLKPGMSAEVTIFGSSGETAGGVIAVPETAVHTYEGRTVVFVPVAGEPNTFGARPVSVGRTIAGMVPVNEGLAEGELVVTEGSFIIKADLGKSGAAHEH